MPPALALKALNTQAAHDIAVADIEMNRGLAEPSVLSSVEVAGMSRLDDVIARRLLDAHAKARTRRLRITGTSLVLGAVATVLGVVLLFTQTGMVGTLGILLIACGTYFCSNAMLATDRTAIRVFAFFFMLLMLFTTQYASQAVFLQDSSFITNPAPCFNESLPGVTGFCIGQNGQYWIDFSTFLGCALFLLWSSRPARGANGKWRFAIYPRVVLGRIWLVARTVTLNSGCAWFFSGLLRIAFSSDIPGARNHFDSPIQQFSTAAVFLVFALLCFKSARSSFQRLLAGRGAAAEEASAAASVSAVIGGATDVGQALAAAVRVFRAISFEQLTAADLDSNQAAPDLNLKATAARLGEIDFFFSHSWHDNAANKWKALARYAERFKTERGRAPLMWLDRACLNQDIAGSLSHLPVHMAGCKGLLVVAGSTYTTRLWTLVELYVWMAMGKEQNRIKLIVIGDETVGDAEPSMESLGKVTATFKTVNIKQSGCSSESDREKVLAIIESSYSSLSAFDSHISRLLINVSDGQKRKSLSRSSTSSLVKAASRLSFANALAKSASKSNVAEPVKV